MPIVSFKCRHRVNATENTNGSKTIALHKQREEMDTAIEHTHTVTVPSTANQTTPTNQTKPNKNTRKHTALQLATMPWP